MQRMEGEDWKKAATYGKLKSTLSMIEFRITIVKCYKKIYHFNSSTIRKNKWFTKGSESTRVRLWSDRKTIGNERFCSVVTTSFFLLCSRGMLLKIGVRLAVISQCLEIHIYKFSHVVAPHFIGLVLAPGALETLLKKEPRPFFKAGVPCSNKSLNELFGLTFCSWPSKHQVLSIGRQRKF